MKKLLFIAVAVIASGCGVIVLMMVSLGYFPELSRVIGLGAPRDLGVEYTAADYAAAQDKLNQAMRQQFINTSFTPAELTALLSGCSQTACVTQATQVRLTADGGLELSGFVDRERLENLLRQLGDESTSSVLISSMIEYLPAQSAIYLEAELVGKADVIFIDLDQLSLGGLRVSDHSLDNLESELSQLVNDYLVATPGTQLTQLLISEDGLNLEADIKGWDLDRFE